MQKYSSRIHSLIHVLTLDLRAFIHVARDLRYGAAISIADHGSDAPSTEPNEHGGRRGLVAVRERMIREGLAAILRVEARCVEVIQLIDPKAVDTSYGDLDVAIVEIAEGESVQGLTARLCSDYPGMHVIVWYPGPERRCSDRPTIAPVLTVGSSIAGVVGDSDWPIAAARNNDAGPHPRQTISLPHRASEVLQLLAEGLTTREIAEHLGISAKTVEHHKHSLYTRLDVHSQAHAIAVALQVGLLRSAN